MARELVFNPYKNIDWESIDIYPANLHQHSTESDGRQSVSIMIDQCVQEQGEGVFTISDHDTVRTDRGMYPKVTGTSDQNNDNYDPARPDGRFKFTFPFSKFDHDVYYDPNSEGNYTELAREGTSGEFDMDENGIMPNGLLAVKTMEITGGGSNFNHIISAFGDYDGFPGGYTEEQAVEKISEGGGISYFAHPGKDCWDYTKKYEDNERYSPDWYKKTISSTKSCLGIEIFNAGNRLPNDQFLLDGINNTGFDVRPIFAFAGTDSHMNFNTREKNMVFMAELSEVELINRIKNGHFFACTGYNAPKIIEINVDEEQKTITIETENQFDMVRWISGGVEVFVGKVLDYGKTKGISGNVRAVIGSGLDMSATNPFYFNKWVKPKFL